MLAKIGKVAAATTTTLLIQHFKASQIVFTGVAGGIGAKVKVGDLIIATELLQHDMNASPLFPIYEIPLYGRSHFPTHTRLSFELQNVCEQVVQEIQNPQTTSLSIQALRQGLLELRALVNSRTKAIGSTDDKYKRTCVLQLFLG